jgi:predicted lysophospholipase L1 biosynthesis ABC-type transport system permease subunit
MKFAGLLVMPAGFLLAIAALILFSDQTQQLAFVLSGVAVEALGLGVAVRGFMLASRENRQ